MRRSGLPRLEKSGCSGRGGEGAVRAQQDIASAVLGEQRVVVAGQQDGDGIGAEQGARGQLGSNAEKLAVTQSGGSKIHVLQDVMQGDVGVIAGGADKSRRGQPRECGDGHVWRGKGGKDKIEPDHVGIEAADGVQQTEGIGQAPEFPAADDVEPRQLRLLFHLQRPAIFIGGKFVIGQLDRREWSTRCRRDAAVRGQYEMRIRSTGARWGERYKPGKSSSSIRLRI